MTEGVRKGSRFRRVLRFLTLREPEQEYGPGQVDPAIQRQREIQDRIATDQAAREAMTAFWP